MQDISNKQVLIDRLLQIQSKLNSLTQDLIDLKAGSRYLQDYVVPSLLHYEVRIFTKRSKDSPTISVKRDSGEGYEEYDRELWERIIRHGADDLFPNHLRRCASQYSTRKSHKEMHSADTRFLNEAELRRLKFELQESRTYSEFKTNLKIYQEFLNLMTKQRESHVSKLTMYNGIEFKQDVNYISDFNIR